MDNLILTGAVFVAAILSFIAVYSLFADLFFRDRSRVNQRINEEFRRRQRDKARKSVLFKDLSAQALEAAAAKERTSLSEKFLLMVDQSGLDISARRLVLMMIVAGLIPGLIAGALRQSVLVAIAVGGITCFLPMLYVMRKRQQRLDRLMSQLPDAFDLMARVIRAGQTMSQAIQAVADEFDQPIAGEFSYCYEQQNLGMPTEFALRDLARRTGLLEVKVFVLGMLVQQQTGGNLAEMLDKLSNLIRERFRMRGKIKALTAEGRLQAAILLALPPIVLVALTVIHPTYISTLLAQPVLLVGMFIMELVGAIWIRSIVNFDF